MHILRKKQCSRHNLSRLISHRTLNQHGKLLIKIYVPACIHHLLIVRLITRIQQMHQPPRPIHHLKLVGTHKPPKLNMRIPHCLTNRVIHGHCDSNNSRLIVRVRITLNHLHNPSLHTRRHNRVVTFTIFPGKHVTEKIFTYR